MQRPPLLMEFPDMKSEWAKELICLWGIVSTMTSSLNSCFLRGASAKGGCLEYAGSLQVKGPRKKVTFEGDLDE